MSFKKCVNLLHDEDHEMHFCEVSINPDTAPYLEVQEDKHECKDFEDKNLLLSKYKTYSRDFHRIKAAERDQFFLVIDHDRKVSFFVKKNLFFQNYEDVSGTNLHPPKVEPPPTLPKGKRLKTTKQK